MTSADAITGLNFTPDWVWLKKKSERNYSGHALFDSVRGED